MNKSKKLLATLALFGLVLTSGTTASVFAAGNIISREAAANIAFTKAGVSKNQATAIEIEIEYDANDDYGQVYEIEFKANGFKYSYDIDANDGTVLKVEKKKLKIKTKITNSSQYIGVASAKSIALNHSGLSSYNVTFTKAKLTTEDGIRVYDVEFRTADTEYDYEINAKTGKIIEFSSEPIDDED
nr:PepSY domain-containing protein [uncultured Catonella sp.]